MPNLSSTYIMLKVKKLDSSDWVIPVQPQDMDYVREDFDSEDSGRFMSGDMERDRIATKIKLQCKWSYMTSDEVATLLDVIDEVFFEVRFFDFKKGTFSEEIMYAGNIEIPYYNVMRNSKGEVIGVKSFSVNLIQK